MGHLFDREETTDEDLDKIHVHNRNYRLAMTGIRVLSMVQAASIFLRVYNGNMSHRREVVGVLSLIGFIYGSDVLNYYVYEKNT